MYHDQNHPGIVLGKWLVTARQKRGLVLRVFAMRIGMNLARYGEVEHGCTSWLKPHHLHYIKNTLELTEDQTAELELMYEASSKATQLTFSDIFTRDATDVLRHLHT